MEVSKIIDMLKSSDNEMFELGAILYLQNSPDIKISIQALMDSSTGNHFKYIRTYADSKNIYIKNGESVFVWNKNTYIYPSDPRFTLLLDHKRIYL